MLGVNGAGQQQVHPLFPNPHHPTRRILDVAITTTMCVVILVLSLVLELLYSIASVHCCTSTTRTTAKTGTPTTTTELNNCKNNYTIAVLITILLLWYTSSARSIVRCPYFTSDYASRPRSLCWVSMELDNNKYTHSSPTHTIPPAEFSM